MAAGQRGGQIRKLGKLDTRAVALVTAGANKKRIAFTKSEGGMPVAQILVDLITKGDLPIDETQIDAQCKESGIDPQGAETIKAVARLLSAFGDSAPMQQIIMGMLPQIFATAGAGEEQPTTLKPSDGTPPAPKEEPPG